MLKNYSKEQVARVVSALVLVIGFFGYKSGASVSEITNSIDTLVVASAFLIAQGLNIYGYFRRYFKGDVSLGGKYLE